VPIINQTNKFDINEPILPKAIKNNAFISGNYPYPKKLKRALYDEQLANLHLELVKLQAHLQKTNERIAIVFEGRDAAGKGGAIKNFLLNLNPRHNKIIALPKPNDTELSQWYFQRYVKHLPSAGETALFDRSWYNRAGVEPVMGFCTKAQSEHFLIEAPRFESMIVDDNIHFFKFWLNIGKEMQIKRFHDRAHDPLKKWKLSPIDLKALDKWDDYTLARNVMLKATHSRHAPWQVILANDKRRSRIEIIRHLLNKLNYEGKDKEKIGQSDKKISLTANQFLRSRSCNDEG